ncbi:hypothetical protein K505DRAFT_255929 [Melanomma pulvis-pyrius CBS 109.77]|uniref:Autophagy-related protein 1 n=1 Tax=Melanomma pulvis-pyrius CBS 109.77 TaxID=1314802 RepID=A0A6A6WVW0_9PLEO|nr:hypothetical protein K505DRAFT_255929 [Melanomma pulvis-pyrius CBS 109.77]
METTSSDALQPGSGNGNGAVTPPSTPTWATHSKSSSVSSIANSLSSLRRGDSTSSHTSRRGRGTSISEGRESNDETDGPGSRELRVFIYWMSDYEIKSEDKKKLLGSGLWSDVYLGTPCLPKHHVEPPLSVPVLTPPITPIKSRASSISKHTLSLPSLPRSYAIKHPASKASKRVLGAEAKILSYLSRFPHSARYIVDFYGQDMRTEALVLRAMDTTLESFMQEELDGSVLSEAARARRLAVVWPKVAKDLVEGLVWLGQRGVVHADVKPANVLLEGDGTGSKDAGGGIKAVYSDFSSSVFLPSADDASISSATTAGSSAAPLGGGTWDYLDPLLLSSSSSPASSPSAQSDLWSLALTLLTLAIGASPFDCAGANVFRRREMVKHGTPLLYAGYGDLGPRNLARLRGLSRDLGWDVEQWFEGVLKKEEGARLGVGRWREMLETRT